MEQAVWQWTSIRPLLRFVTHNLIRKFPKFEIGHFGKQIYGQTEDGWTDRPSYKNESLYLTTSATKDFMLTVGLIMIKSSARICVILDISGLHDASLPVWFMFGDVFLLCFYWSFLFILLFVFLLLSSFPFFSAGKWGPSLNGKNRRYKAKDGFDGGCRSNVAKGGNRVDDREVVRKWLKWHQQ